MNTTATTTASSPPTQDQPRAARRRSADRSAEATNSGHTPAAASGPRSAEASDARPPSRSAGAGSSATSPPSTSAPSAHLTATLAALRDLTAARAAWDNHDGPYVDFQGRPTKDLPDGFGDLLDALLAHTSRPDLPTDCYALALAADRLEDAAAAYFRDRETYPEHTPPGGSTDFWIAFEALAETAARITTARAPLQPPNIDLELRRGTPAATIALQLGWYVLNPITGEPARPLRGDAERVREEHLSPGTHLDPRTWIAPADSRRAARLAADFDARNAARAPLFAERAAMMDPADATTGELSTGRAARPRRPVEPIEDLARLPGMTVDQIAKIHRTTPDDIRAQLLAAGLILEPAGLRHIGPTAAGHYLPAGLYTAQAQAEADRRALEEDQYLANFDPHDEHGADIDGRILACHLDGYPATLTARLLSRRTSQEITVRRVNRVVAEAGEAEETAAKGPRSDGETSSKE